MFIFKSLTNEQLTRLGCSRLIRFFTLTALARARRPTAPVTLECAAARARSPGTLDAWMTLPAIYWCPRGKRGGVGSGIAS